VVFRIIILQPLIKGKYPAERTKGVPLFYLPADSVGKQALLFILIGNQPLPERIILSEIVISANLNDIKRMDENETRKLRRYQSTADGKNVLRQAMAKILSADIVKRQKQGFSAPDESWYRGESLAYVKEVLLNKRASYRDFINPHYVKRVVDEHVAGKKNHRLLLWSFLSFEWWCKIFLDGVKLG